MLKTKTPKITILYQNEQQGFFGISQCPGKNFTTKKGIQRKNDLKKDLQNFKAQGINIIVNLLNIYDLRVIGVDIKQYQKLCNILSIQLINLPIIEMSVPEISMQEIQIFAKQLVDNIQKGQGIVIHCRGGVGRAGLLAGIILAELKVYNKYDECLQFLRQTRHSNCVESMKQRDYLQKYFKNFVN